MFFDNSLFQRSLVRLRSIGMYVLTILSSFARPVLYVWPWILGVGVFTVFVRSPQGMAVAERYADETYRLREIVGCIVATWLGTGIASLLALMAPSMRHKSDRLDDPVAQVKSRIDVLTGGLWVVILSSAYGALFAQAVHMNSAWAAVGSLALAGAITTILIVRSQRHETSRVAQVLGGVRRYQLLIVSSASLLALGPLALGAITSVSDPLRLSDAGPLLVAMVGIAAISTLLGIILVVVPLHLKRPWIGVAFVAVTAGWTASHRPPIDVDNPLLRDYFRTTYSASTVKSTVLPTGVCASPPFSLEDSLNQHIAPKLRLGETDFNRDVYLVSAEGGGIRAAYWTAITLAQLDISTRGRFGEKVASLSGVSGGSLGIATWLAARDRSDLGPQPRLKLITQFLGSDFLSPALGGFLFLDVPRLLMGPLWPSVRRDQVFEKALADRWRLIGKTDFFGKGMLHLCIHGFRVAPAFFFNATDSRTGAYVPLSPSQGFHIKRESIWDEAPDPKEFPSGISWREPGLLQNTSLAKATVAQMVSISARFPYLSPEAQVGINASVLARHKVDEERGYNWDLSTPSDTQEETRRRAEIRARLAAIDSENLWSRVWVLVDGGYFDNTGLTPTREAIAFIDEQRGKEVTSPSEQRLFTKTRVHVVHISSDPGTLCFALPQGWRERLSPRATRFLQVSQQTVRCAQDISSLEESLSQNPFDSFLAPIESLVNVRVEHSRQAVRELRQNISWSRQGYVLEMRELASELADAYGSLRKERGHSEAEIVQASTARVLEGERRASRDKEEVSRLVGHGISQASADAYFSALSEWQEMLREESREAECHKQFAPVGPPLGWTLNKTNQELMQCMSVRGRIVGGILGQFPEPPDFPRLGKDYSAEHLDSDSSPKELQVSR